MSRCSCIIAWGLLLIFMTPAAATARGQSLPKSPATQSSHASERSRNSPSVYEDRYVRIKIPEGWKIAETGFSEDDPRMPHRPGVPQTFMPTPGSGLLLTKMNYTLTIAYKTGHASPITGGRFIEVIRIPWLEEISDSWGCSTYLRQIPQPMNKNLMFVNLGFDHPNSESRTQCQLPVDFAVGRRWLAGYFTTTLGAWYFESGGPGCPEKAYTLTSGAEKPFELPDPNDAVLRKIIHEAIGTVASILYKICPPEAAGDQQ